MKYECMSSSTLEGCHTRELLALKAKGYAVGWPLEAQTATGEVIKISHAELVDILSEREHIPTKAEARVIRQNKAKVRK